jgi:phenylacetate-CoA ligase
VNLFDLSIWFYGFPLGKAMKRLKEIQAKNEHDFNDYLKKSRRDIVEYHLANNPLYRSIAPNANPENWDAIPIMSKRDLQIPLSKRLSKGFTKHNVYINKTSGSTGDPFVFAKDRFCHAMTWAIIQDRFDSYQLDFNHSRQARFYGIPLSSTGYYKERFKDFLSKRWRFSVFDLSDDAFERHVKLFQKKQFDYINGYTSSIVQFAKYLNRQGLVLRSICPSLKYCMVTSEMLFDHDRHLLETQLGVPVVNEYGAAELDLIAFENPDNQWSVNHESLLVEVVDNRGKSLPNGEEGRIVVTSLYNKAHPFIRYDLGDIGILSKKSAIRAPILKKLTGRTNDIAILPSGKKAAGLTFYYITKSIIEDDGNVKEFVIEQTADDTFIIRYVSTEELGKKKIRAIFSEMENYLEKGLNIQFERHPSLQRSKSGKLKQFSSLINIET